MTRRMWIQTSTSSGGCSMWQRRSQQAGIHTRTSLQCRTASPTASPSSTTWRRALSSRRPPCLLQVLGQTPSQLARNLACSTSAYVRLHCTGSGTHGLTQTCLCTGRVYIKRSSGAKLLFYDVKGDGAKIQVMADLRCRISTTYRLSIADIPCKRLTTCTQLAMLPL